MPFTPTAKQINQTMQARRQLGQKAGGIYRDDKTDKVIKWKIFYNINCFD